MNSKLFYDYEIKLNINYQILNYKGYWYQDCPPIVSNIISKSKSYILTYDYATADFYRNINIISE